MHIENFKIFSDLVESHSFSLAAKRNGITQSAVSQQLRAMEKHFNVLIIDRSRKQFQLTTEGSKIYDFAQELLRWYEKLGSELQEMKNVVSGIVHIATVYSIGLYELPSYVKQFLQRFPTANVRVEYRRSNLVYEDVLQNVVDLGLVAYPTKMQQLEVIPFQKDQLVVICAPGHPLAGKKEVSLEVIAEKKWIAFDQDIPTRKAIDQVFHKAKLTILPVMELDNVETVKRAVEIDAGIAMVPSSTIVQEVKQGLLHSISIKGAELVRPLAIIHRKGRILTPAMKHLIALLKES